ncbi:hypothetical protein L6R52_31235 [Myxococcota bacterium]|nr:hypothetical protein [Myxococcota bacterium]
MRGRSSATRAVTLSRRGSCALAWLVAPVLLAACSADVPAARPDAGDARDAGDAAPTIRAFTADPAIVPRGSTSRLAWSVDGADRIEITGPSGTFVSTFTPQSSVETPPLFEATTWTLHARRGSAVSTASAAIAIAWQPITIDDVSLEPRVGFIGDTARILWQATNAVRVRVLVGERVLVDRAVELPVDSEPIVIEAEETTLTFELSNPAFVERRELSLRGIPRPTLERFVVHPRALFARARTATISWAVRDTRSTELWLDGVALVGFPGTLTGTATMTFTDLGAHELWLVANSGRDFTVLTSRRLESPGFEREPNHDLERSNDLSGAGAAIGQIREVDDTDFYSYQAPAGGRFRVTTTGLDGRGCTTDTRVHVTDFGGVLLVEGGDGGAPIDDGGACASVEVALGDPRGSAPPFVIVVSGERGDTGDYAVIVEDL